MDKLNYCYLDNLNGNDSNDGLTKETPFKTIDKAKSFIVSKGKDGIIYLIGYYELPIWSLVIKNNSINIVGVDETSELKYVYYFADDVLYIQNVNFYKLKTTFGETRWDFHPWTENVNFYNCIIKYSGCPFYKDVSNFYNCLFLDTITRIDYRQAENNYNMSGKFVNCIFNSKVFTQNTGFKFAIKQPYNLLTDNITFYVDRKNKNDSSIKNKGSNETPNKNGGGSDIGLFGGSYPYIFIERKYIIKQDDKYYSIKIENYDETTHKFKEIILSNINQPNKVDFETYGIDDLGILTLDMIKGSDSFKPITKFNKIQIISGTESVEVSNLENSIFGTFQGKLITPKNPRLLPMNIKKLNKLTVTSNVIGSGIIKYAVSFDGEQYKTWNGAIWENIDLTIDNVKNKGMTIPTINNVITWETIRGNSTKIWLAKYIEMDTSANKCEIDKEEINFDENGYWRSLNSSEMATHPVTYGKNENNLFDSATVTNNSGTSENLMITSLSFVTTTDTKFKTFSITGSNDLVSSVENGTLTFDSKNKTIKMISDDTTDTIDFDVDINTLPTF